MAVRLTSSTRHQSSAQKKRLYRRFKSILPPKSAHPATPRRRHKLTPLPFLKPIILTLFLALLPICIWLLLNHHLRVQQIRCTLSQAPCPDSIYAELNHFIGTPVYKIDTTSAITKITGFNPSIVSISHQYQPLYTLEFTISEAPPLALIHTGTGSALLLVSQNRALQVPPHDIDTHLGVIVASASHQLQPNTRVTDHDLSLALDLVILLKDYFIPYVSLTIDQPDRSLLTLNPNLPVYISLYQDLERQVKALSLIVNQYPEDSPIYSIDIRPLNPIIRHSPPPVSTISAELTPSPPTP